ncbi:hypothetical protein BCR32DRAFT_275244 [Anaeromyces robustus]|uniref:Uncharacterized protein n=1 Tax=Anaeromyces robustus TaxID=1754192 RepID=A0A1Y1XLI9_9FUNG|nr:hypothetical protein BCR32DRAFT_275244 [Anaeromyces robustus]|eukprot:ORX86602.1 hypothetical protein BCR32DRAFT_275244 [Anaeromyces robustus]
MFIDHNDDFDTYKGETYEPTDFRYTSDDEKNLCYSGKNNPYHGTITSSIVGGKLFGVAKKANIHMIAIDFSDSSILKSFDYIIKNGKKHKTISSESNNEEKIQKCTRYKSKECQTLYKVDKQCFSDENYGFYNEIQEYYSNNESICLDELSFSDEIKNKIISDCENELNSEQYKEYLLSNYSYMNDDKIRSVFKSEKCQLFYDNQYIMDYPYCKSYLDKMVGNLDKKLNYGNEVYDNAIKCGISSVNHSHSICSEGYCTKE